jgi:anti-anti-sigma regulatory factor
MGSDSPQLRLRTTAIRTGVQLVTAKGELERSTVPELERELAAVPVAADVIVDLDEAEIADAAPLGVLRLRAARLRELGNELTVVCERDAGARTLLKRDGVSVSANHDGALRYLLGRRLLRRLRGH